MKLGFIERIYLAITDFRMYPYVIKEKYRTALGYFLGFVFLVAIILSVNAYVKTSTWVKYFVEDYYKNVSEFSIDNNMLETEENMDFDFLKVKIYTDDTKSFDESELERLDLKNYRFSILGYKDKCIIGSNSLGYMAFTYENVKTNRDGVFSIINQYKNDNAVKFGLLIGLFCSIFILYFITKFVFALFTTIMLLFLGMIFRTKYKFIDYMKVAFYVMTLPTITEIIALIVIGELNEYANITYYLLSYVYMFYAIRALKLDNIILSTQASILGFKNAKQKENQEDLKNQESKNQETKDDKNSDEK